MVRKDRLAEFGYSEGKAARIILRCFGKMDDVSNIF